MELKTSNEIVVLGNKIQTKIEELDIFSLRYWKENPRVNSAIKQNFGNKDISELEIEELLWKLESVKDLKFEIEKHHGLIDEILVKGNIVLEGNSRLCAYRHLFKKAKEKNDLIELKKWANIRARIIPDETKDEIIFSILGTWHIKGKKEWDTYEKAAYLKKMNTDYNYSFKKIADSIGTKENYVKQHIKAYDMMVDNNVYEIEKFSYFIEFIKNTKANEIALKEPNVFYKTVEAIKNGKFKRAEQVRDLHKVLTDKVAKKDFIDENADFDHSLEITKDRHPELEDTFFSHIKKTTNLLEKCTMQRIEEIKADNKKSYYLKKLYKEVQQVCKKSDII